MSGYEARRRQHVDLAISLAPQLIEQLGLAGRRRTCTWQLRELVRTATDRSPWYRKRLADVDIDRLDTAGPPSCRR